MTQEASTTWEPTNPQIGEYSIRSAYDIVDPSANYLVDPSGNNIVDTGAVFTGIASTTWVDSPGN